MIVTMCRVLGVSSCGYYAWRTRPLSGRAEADPALLTRIRNIHAQSRGTYGAPLVHAELSEAGVRCGRRRAMRACTARIAAFDSGPRHDPR